MAAAQPWRRQPRYERLLSGERISFEGRNRTCAHPECETRLSRYNPDGTCSRHGGWTDESFPHRGRKPARRLQPAEQEQHASNYLGNGNGTAGQHPAALLRGPVPASAMSVPVTVSAEIRLASGALKARAALAEEVLRVLQSVAVHVECGDGSVVVTGDAQAVLGAVERVHQAIAPRSRRLITDIRLEAFVDDEEAAQAD